jgi:integrase
MIKSKRIGNANSYKSFKAAFLRYFPKTDTLIQSITFNQVVGFELNMIKHGLSTNGIASYMRTFRAIYNSAIKDEIILDYNNPFKKYSIKTETTKNKYLTQEEIHRIISFKPTNPQMELTLDLILSMFYLVGINFKDLLQLKWTDIKNNTISYKRSKTHKVYNIVILDSLSTIFKKYEVNRSKYIFPILSDNYNQLEDYKIIKNRTKTFNKNFSKITQSKVSSYYIRYSWARYRQGT